MKTHQKLTSLFAAICTLFLPFNAFAKELYTASLTTKLKPLLGPQTQFEIVPFNDDFELVKVNGQVLFASKNGNYLFAGKVIDIRHRVDLVEQAKQQIRQSLISTIPREKLLSYKASNEKHRLTIFTDIDCPFCKKLHTQISALNQNGITVDYVMLPRGQTGSAAFNKTVNALCAANPQLAMNEAMHQGQYQHTSQITESCSNNLVAQQSLAQQFRFSATPTILFANGEVVPGLMKTEDIVEKLSNLSAE